ncbi:MAG: hypothetical protein JRG95_21705 [Deltaproteobacteria bacterium]|nr:hypothetical protein [Deltaproteobacteria bacterium]
MPNLYLPITSQPRELEAKLLLALFAKESGMSPVFGYKSAFQSQLASLPPGFFLAHNARQKSEWIDRVRKFGHRVLVMDEEALVRQSDEIFLKKHRQDAFDHVAHILCWGEDDNAMWGHSNLDFSGGVSIVGNPRMDLMRHEMAPYYAARVTDIQVQYGDYVLLNTNFSTVNNLTPKGGGVRIAKWAKDDRGKQLTADFLSNKSAMLEAVLGLVRPLADAIAPMTLLVRPHPNEDHTPWERAVGEVANAHVVFEGGVVPWIIGARALVHNSCTTAVEAAVGGTPVLNFRPWKSEYDNSLSHAFGQDCADSAALASALQALSEGQTSGLSQQQKALLSHHIASLEGPFSCERIVDLLCAPEQAIDQRSRVGFVDRMMIDLRLRRLWMKRFIQWYSSRSGRKKRRFLRARFPQLSLHKLDFEMLGYNKQQLELFVRQFPELRTADLDEWIGRFAAVLSRFKGLRAVKLKDNLFTIA